MIQSSTYDFNKIINKVEKVDKKVDFKSSNIKMMKEYQNSPIYIFVFLLILLSVVIIPATIIKGENIKDILSSLIIIPLGCSIFTFFLLKEQVDILAYYKLKKIIKHNDYEVYKYNADITSKYEAQALDEDRTLDSPTPRKQVVSNGIKMIIDNQTIYLEQRVFQEILLDKKIVLYFAKYGNLVVLFDYERVTS